MDRMDLMDGMDPEGEALPGLKVGPRSVSSSPLLLLSSSSPLLFSPSAPPRRRAQPADRTRMGAGRDARRRRRRRDHDRAEAARRPMAPCARHAGRTARPRRSASPDRRLAVSGGRASPLVVLHGLGVRKETMLALLSGLRMGRRAIAPDLPGFGEHRLSPDLADAITRESFAHGMRPTFAEAMDRRCGPETDAYLDAIAAWLERAIEGPFDLLGASMGGALAASLAARMPDRVERLVLLGPAGVRAPRLNEFMREVEADRNPLEIRTVEDLDRVTRLNFVTPPHIPRPIRAALAEDLRARQSTQDLVIDALGPLLLDGLRETLPQVEAKTLVLWGERDEILDASAAEVFAAAMRHATVEVVPNAGHTLHGDRPKEVVPRVRAFLRR
jgi:abhydrolase domain-containing protein 6